MGLTLHYRLTAPADCSARRAAAMVWSFHDIARRWAAAGRLAAVHDISTDHTDLDRFGNEWLSRPAPDQPNTVTGLHVSPVSGWIFPVDLGEGCEWLWLGLCRYPATIVEARRRRRTRLGAHWQFGRSCKTQYASLHGWENFVRCHVGAVDLLDEWRKLGGGVTISDEGHYWPNRDLTALRRNVGRMNRLVAAFAGAMKDAGDGNSPNPVQSPIFGHPQFERLEAEGATRAGKRLGAAVKLVTRATKP
jgi:hypothetical protein